MIAVASATNIEAVRRESAPPRPPSSRAPADLLAVARDLHLATTGEAEAPAFQAETDALVLSEALEDWPTPPGVDPFADAVLMVAQAALDDYDAAQARRAGL